jgi:hypothetical protein
MVESRGESAADKKHRSSNAPASAAIGYLINHLEELSPQTGYHPPRNVKVREILDEHGPAGHSVVLPAPKKGFTTEQRDAIETYSNTLTYWQHLLVEIEWKEDSVTVSFKRLEETEEDREKEKKLTLREKLRGQAYRAVRAMGQALVDHGFMVREPVETAMVTLEARYNGWAIMMKYPSAGTDQAGIQKAYDKWVPLLTDAFARAEQVKGETAKDGLVTTIFFTKDKRYVSSVYDKRKMLRIFVPKEKMLLNLMFFTRSTYRACNSISKRYKKDFNVSKRPMNAWGVKGHSILMNYRKGAAGKLVDESYVYNVRLIAEKTMRKYGLMASIKHHADTRSLVVTFYSGSNDKWSTMYRPMDGVAVVNYDDSRSTVNS